MNGNMSTVLWRKRHGSIFGLTQRFVVGRSLRRISETETTKHILTFSELLLLILGLRKLDALLHFRL
jgi:hypothetical protein